MEAVGDRDPWLAQKKDEMQILSNASNLAIVTPALGVILTIH